jgi:hypothetical protein
MRLSIQKDDKPITQRCQMRYQFRIVMGTRFKSARINADGNTSEAFIFRVTHNLF